MKQCDERRVFGNVVCLVANGLRDSRDLFAVGRLENAANARGSGISFAGSVYGREGVCDLSGRLGVDERFEFAARKPFI